LFKHLASAVYGVSAEGVLFPEFSASPAHQTSNLYPRANFPDRRMN